MNTTYAYALVNRPEFCESYAFEGAMKLSTLFTLTLIAGSATAIARADSFQVNYMNAGAQTSSVSNYSENFNSAAKNSNGVFTTNFNGSGVTGTYSGSYNFFPAGPYGGAGGTGQYVSTGSYSGTGTPYTLSLSSNINYFGLWFSALDQGNSMGFYNNNSLLYTFTATDYIKAVGGCPGTAYCGNPNNGADPWEQFAFLNFYDANGSFNKIVFSQVGSYVGDFESDNHTIGNISSMPGGTTLATTPEPSSLALLGTGALSLAGLARRRFFGA